MDEWSIRRRDLYLTIHNIHNRQTSMPPVGIGTHNLSRRAAEYLRLRPRGHWDRRSVSAPCQITSTLKLRQVQSQYHKIIKIYENNIESFFSDTTKSVRRLNILYKQCLFVAAYTIPCWYCYCAGLACNLGRRRFGTPWWWYGNIETYRSVDHDCCDIQGVS